MVTKKRADAGAAEQEKQEKAEPKLVGSIAESPRLYDSDKQREVSAGEVAKYLPLINAARRAKREDAIREEYGKKGYPDEPKDADRQFISVLNGSTYPLQEKDIFVAKKSGKNVYGIISVCGQKYYIQE